MIYRQGRCSIFEAAKHEWVKKLFSRLNRLQGPVPDTMRCVSQVFNRLGFCYVMFSEPTARRLRMDLGMYASSVSFWSRSCNPISETCSV